MRTTSRVAVSGLASLSFAPPPSLPCSFMRLCDVRTLRVPTLPLSLCVSIQGATATDKWRATGVWCVRCPAATCRPTANNLSRKAHARARGRVCVCVVVHPAADSDSRLPQMSGSGWVDGRGPAEKIKKKWSQGGRQTRSRHERGLLIAVPGCVVELRWMRWRRPKGSLQPRALAICIASNLRHSAPPPPPRLPWARITATSPLPLLSSSGAVCSLRRPAHMFHTTQHAHARRSGPATHTTRNTHNISRRLALRRR